jgi:integrase
MKKLRFKNRDGILYFGVGDTLKSSKLKYNNINKNIIIGKFNRGELDDEVQTKKDALYINVLLETIISDKAKSLKPSSANVYRILGRKHILAYFDKKTVKQIRPIDIKKFQDYLVEIGLGQQTIKIVRVLLKEVFSIAILSEDIATNPVLMVSPPKFRERKKKVVPFSLDEIDMLLNASDKTLENFLGISFFTGMRSGELLALKWDDIDFATDTIAITKTISAGDIGTPKTRSSEREIEMNNQARHYFKSQKFATGLKNSYIFLNSKSSHHTGNTWFYRNYQRVLKELGLDIRDMHHTRHTFASLMLNNGIDPMWVCNTLGHESLKITLDVYGHFMPKKEKMVLPFLEKRYKQAQ